MAKEFPPNVSTSYLRKLKRNEEDHRAKMILLACIAKKEKKEIRGTEQTLNKPYNMVRDWINRVSEGRLKRRHDIKNRGAKCKLDDR